MIPSLRRRRSGLLDMLKGVSRQKSKQEPNRTDDAGSHRPQRILKSYPVDPTSSIPEKIPSRSESIQNPRRLHADPRDAHCWSYWGPTKSLSSSNLEALMKRHCFELTGGSWDPQFRLDYRIAGAHHTVYVLQSTHGHQVKICVRVPAWGWIDRWNERDAEMFRATALGMRYVREKFGLSIPEVLAYDMTMDNELGAPYIIMTFLEGIRVDQVWDGVGSEEPEQIEARRQTILRSLANTMSLLGRTSFPVSGTLWFPDYGDDQRMEIGVSWRLKARDAFVLEREHVQEEPKRSVADYLHAARTARIEEDREAARGLSVYRKGVFTLWALMIRSFLQSTQVHHSGAGFVLMHSDFSQSNILVSEDGTVTGLVGWDCFQTVPRQMGWCSIPSWLQQDWAEDHQWPASNGVESALHPDEYALYRQDYTKYMREACGNRGDSRFTSKSHIYHALFRSAESFEGVEHFVLNILADVLPRNVLSWRTQLLDIGGAGFRPGEREWFEKTMFQYFMPDADIETGPPAGEWL